MLYSYLLDPTYSSHSPARSCAAPLQPEAELARWRNPPTSPAAFRQCLRQEVETAGLLKLYEEIDLPLVPVLAAHGAGRRQDRSRSSGENVVASGTRSSTPRHGKSMTNAGVDVQHQFAQAAGRRALQPDESAQAGEVRQGQDHFDRGRCAGRTGRDARSCRAWCWNTASSPSSNHLRGRAAGC